MMTQLFTQADFRRFEYWQTLFGNNDNIIEQPKEGFGEGGFVVIKAQKQNGN